MLRSPTSQSRTASRLNSPVNVHLSRFLMDHPRRFLVPSRVSIKTGEAQGWPTIEPMAANPANVGASG